MEKDLEGGGRSESSPSLSESTTLLSFSLNSLQSTPVTATLAGATLTLTLLGALIDLDTVLSFTPGGLMGHFYVWNVFTGALYHSSRDLGFFFAASLVALNIVILVWAGSYLERFWGRNEYLKFLGLTLGLSAVVTLLLTIFVFLITGDYGFMARSIGGFTAGSAALVTAMKQLRPEEDALMGIRIKNLPLLYVVSVSVAMLFLSHSSMNIPYVILGWLISWVYLRWFQVRGEDVRGDSATEMNFASFFPEALQPSVFVVSQILQRFCFFWMPKQKSTNVRTSTGALVSILDAPQDVERRRAIALKALDEKFMSMKSLPMPTGNPTTPSKPVPTTSTPASPTSTNS